MINPERPEQKSKYVDVYGFMLILNSVSKKKTTEKKLCTIVYRRWPAIGSKQTNKRKQKNTPANQRTNQSTTQMLPTHRLFICNFQLICMNFEEKKNGNKIIIKWMLCKFLFLLLPPPSLFLLNFLIRQWDTHDRLYNYNILLHYYQHFPSFDLVLFPLANSVGPEFFMYFDEISRRYTPYHITVNACLNVFNKKQREREREKWKKVSIPHSVQKSI